MWFTPEGKKWRMSPSHEVVVAASQTKPAARWGTHDKLDPSDVPFTALCLVAVKLEGQLQECQANFEVKSYIERSSSLRRVTF